MVSDSMKPIPHDYYMWFIILQSHTHSCDASYNAIILESSVDVATKVCLEDFHEMDVPLCRNTKHVYDLALWGSDR